jgi:hypothetical protein
MLILLTTRMSVVFMGVFMPMLLIVNMEYITCVDNNDAISVALMKLLMLVLQTMSVASTIVLMFLLLTKNVVFVRVPISILVLLRAVSVRLLLLVNMPAIVLAEVLNDVSERLSDGRISLRTQPLSAMVL